jgi:PST family polysaccharide transporter
LQNKSDDLEDIKELTANKLRRAFFGPSVSIISTQAIKLGIQVVSVVILTRLFLPESFGTLSLALLAVLLVEIFRERGYTNVLLSDSSVTRAQINFLAQTQAKWALFGWVILIFVGFIVQSTGRFQNAWEAFGILGAIPVFSSLQMASTVWLSKNQRYLVQNVGEIISYSVSLILTLTLVGLGLGVISLFLQPTVNAALNCLIRFVASPWNVFRSERVEVKELKLKSKAIFFSNLVNFSSANADSASLSLSSSAHILGGYSRLYQIIVGSAGQVVSALANFVLPNLALLKSQPHELTQFTNKLVTRIGLPLGVAAGLASPFSTVFLDWTFGSAWIEFSSIFEILSFCAAFQLMTYMSSWVAMTAMSGRQYLRLSLYTKLPSVVAIFASSFFGVQAIAGTLLLTLIAAWIVFSLAYKRVAGVTFYETTKGGWTVTLVTLVTFAVSYLSIQAFGIA